MRVQTVTKFTATKAALRVAEPLDASLQRRRNNHASQATAFCSFDVVHFCTVIRPGMDRVREPTGSLHGQFSVATENYGDDLQIGARRGSAGAHLQRNAKSEPVLHHSRRLQPSAATPDRESKVLSSGRGTVPGLTWR